MFPRAHTPFRTFLRRSVDAVIDFATLGEYGLASAWEDAATAPPLATPPSPLAPGASALTEDHAPARRATTTAVLLRPASAAGRARRNAERRQAPLCAGQPVWSRIPDPQLPRASRARAGMAPREQVCLLDADDRA